MYTFFFNNKDCVVFHNSGFFSCCSVKLHAIVEFQNRYKRYPNVVDSSKQFEWYKKGNTHQDVTFVYFDEADETSLELSYVDYHWNYQFRDYSTLDYNRICPIVNKYFSPSKEIRDIMHSIESKYQLDYANLCVLFYRGNDKNRETKICAYDEYVTVANNILNNNPNVKFLIQSDETEFIEQMTSTFPLNSLWFQQEIRHMSKCDDTVDLCQSQHNDVFSKYYLAITMIMAKCKFIVCGSGNCSIWIVLYRGNNHNVFQNLNGHWVS
jgi:hypothetical protein